MIIHLYGPDTYSRSEKERAIVAVYEKKYRERPDRFILSEKEDYQKFLLFLGSQSLFNTKSFAIVSDALPEHGKLIKTLLEHKEKTVLIVSDKKMTREFSYLYKAPVTTQEFPELKAEKLLSFIRKEAKVRNVILEDKDIKSLATFCGSNTWDIVNELEKLSLGGDMPESAPERDFFPLVQTFMRGSIESRLSSLQYLLLNNDPAAIFNISASLAGPSQKNKMANYDVAIKSGKLEYEEALLDLVLSD